ncbi:Carotenoid cleavage dioxygenase 7, chloroplastic [Dendrobium catenatum]|uniref:Carotenoid cleavage dioxygenase 7, chloroplastic n=1 Tax=Dendrobium catenatum TaxID=906689 RepID=A0A2I0X7P1_9ASPA|nr:Carotenoid cleavage dioxygenase 7, chloroplastic [Dendrobium catenatum]
MQAAFHHRLLFFSQPLNQPTKTSKLFFFSTTTTPSCYRCIPSPSASSNIPIPSNLPDSSFSSSSSATAAAAITALEDYQRLFSSQPAESVDPLPLVATKGSLPADFPLGTYYLIGPGMISDDHGSTVNPLDGHGYLRAFRFIGGGVVMYSARYVETEAAKEEREAKTGEWRFRRSGIFSRLKSGWRAPSWTCIKNVANTTVLTWAGRLFCLWEGGYPYELEPKSLATVGPADFITAAEGRQRRGGGGGVLNLAAGITKLLIHGNQPTTPIYLLPRFSNNTISRDWRIPIEAPSQLWTCHVGNAYEEKDGNGKTKIKIQASVCSYQWFNQKKLFGYDSQSSKLDPSFMNVEQQLLPHLVKISIELDAEGSCLLCSIVDSSTQWKNLVDFPVINPTNSGKANRFMYASSTSGSREFLPHFPFDTVVKFDFSNGITKSWCTESRKFIGEPMFISKNAKVCSFQAEGKQYAVFKQKCYLVVLDAKRIGHDDAIEVKLEVPKHLTFPFGFHGFWNEKCEV